VLSCGHVYADGLDHRVVLFYYQRTSVGHSILKNKSAYTAVNHSSLLKNLKMITIRDEECDTAVVLDRIIDSFDAALSKSKTTFNTCPDFFETQP